MDDLPHVCWETREVMYLIQLIDEPAMFESETDNG